MVDTYVHIASLAVQAAPVSQRPSLTSVDLGESIFLANSRESETTLVING